jgi:hypothetical protein
VRKPANRLRILSAWIEKRLHEREAVTWATNYLRKIESDLGREMLDLFDYLNRQAENDKELGTEFKELWRLLRTAAHEGVGRQHWYHIENLRRQIEIGTFRVESVNEIVDFVRPRLRASSPSAFERASENSGDSDPKSWVRWDFEASCGSVDSSVAKLSKEVLGRLSIDVLLNLGHVGTAALDAALITAREAGWTHDGRDLTNTFVTFVTPPPQHLLGPTEYEDDDDSRDPDAYHDGFAPLVRLLSSAFDALANKDSVTARQIASAWATRQDALFVRLRAYALWNRSAFSGSDVAYFLHETSDLAFWRSRRFPEVAALRALRWADLPHPDRERIAARLLGGPREVFGQDDATQETRDYVRDYEIARVLDHGGQGPDKLNALLEERRATDSKFPERIAPIDHDWSGVRLRRVPDGDPTSFDSVPDDRLLDALMSKTKDRWIGDGDDAEAFARKHRTRLANVLSQHVDAGEGPEIGWRLLLSHPNDKSDDVHEGRKIAERIAGMVREMHPDLLIKLSDRLSYWLDATDAQHQDFVGSTELWVQLLPHAVNEENTKAADHPHRDHDNETASDGEDLSSTALNSPLGHLISFFLRRCPSMPHTGERPPLPEPFTEALKKLTGRARTILASRMATLLNYFAVAEPNWLEDFVLVPMRGADDSGKQLWEVFGRYGPIPSWRTWPSLQTPLFERLAPLRLSREAQRRLTEMAVVIWAWSKSNDTRYLIDATGLRAILAIGTEEIRSAAAWEFWTLFRHSKDPETPLEDSWPRLGKAFFREVWPIEPALQSGRSANDFARIPAELGAQHYADAVQTVLPYLRPFELWDVESGLGLDKKRYELVRCFPSETLALINACISDDWGTVYHLGAVLLIIRQSSTELARDPRLRRLQRHAASD